MERQKFDDFADLGNYMYELSSEESQVVTAVLLCEDAVQLIKWLMLYEDVTVGSISIESEYYNGYDKEFYITLDTDLVLNVAPVYPSRIGNAVYGFLAPESDVVFYVGDESIELALQNTYGNKYKIIIDNYHYNDECVDCCGDCSNCPNRETSDAIVGSLDLIDYILNHFSDN